MVKNLRQLAFLALWLGTFVSSDLLAKKPEEGGFRQADFEQAKVQALREAKAMLLLFTGSDWCHWCQKLESEVFAKEEFESLAASKAILVRADFPQRRKLAPRQQRRNQLLKAKWNVEAFPTIILYDPQTDRELWRHSYLKSSPKDYADGIARALSSVRGGR